MAKEQQSNPSNALDTPHYLKHVPNGHKMTPTTTLPFGKAIATDNNSKAIHRNP